MDMLSAIGGTMGLLTGFSIISGVEILYLGKLMFNSSMLFIEAMDEYYWNIISNIYRDFDVALLK